MKKVLIFGATGKLGRRIVHRGMLENLELYIFARPDSSLDELPLEEVRIIKGDIRNRQDVKLAFQVDPDLIIFSIGSTQLNDQSVSTGMKHVSEFMKRENTPRLLAVGGAGILQTASDELVMEQATFPPFLRNMAREHLRAWQTVEASDIDYVYLCPNRMESGHFDDPYVTGKKYLLPQSINGISYEACADMLVKEITKPNYSREKVSIASK